MPRSPATPLKAIEAHQRYAALRAIDDPKQLAKAARIVRCALERRRLKLADVVPEPKDAA